VVVIRVSFALLCALCGACTATGYVAQAGLGQLDLFARARDIDEVLDDPNIDVRKRKLLMEVSLVLRYARARGLKDKGNYRKYVDLPRGAVVWFTAAAPELSLEPKEWSFPIVGSFTYLGWFDFVRAMKFRRSLERDGYDVYLRGVRAYSTGG
jgi:predicted aminopeptidase